MNHCTFTGRLTSDPELKNINGKSLVNFTLAVQETKDKAHFLGFTAWEKIADVISKYCKKGNRILVECQAVQETWESQDGKKNSKTKFRVSKVEFLESKKDASDNSNYTEKEQEVNQEDDSVF